jgi:hypothetical protein
MGSEEEGGGEGDQEALAKRSAPETPVGAFRILAPR